MAERSPQPRQRAENRDDRRRQPGQPLGASDLRLKTNRPSALSLCDLRHSQDRFGGLKNLERFPPRPPAQGAALPGDRAGTEVPKLSAA